MLLLVVGLPRSGATWLAKILDSHPATLCLAEDCDSLPGGSSDSLPAFCAGAEVEGRLAVARAHVEAVLNTRTLATIGAMPVFDKDYHGPLTRLVRRASIALLWAAEPLASRAVRRLPLPEPGLTGGPAATVIASNCGLGRLNLLLRARPEARAVVVMRHPCDQIAAARQARAGHGTPAAADDPAIWSALAATPQGRRHRLTHAALSEMSQIERHAWHWAICHEKAMDDAATGLPIRFLRFEDLRADPEATARELVGAIGLPWDHATARFIATSLSLFRRGGRPNGLGGGGLRSGERAKILAIVARTRPGSLFPIEPSGATSNRE